MTELFTKELEGTISTDDFEYDVTVTVTNDRSDICDGEFVCVTYFSEQFCKPVEWTLEEEPTADEIADMIAEREGRTVVF